MRRPLAVREEVVLLADAVADRRIDASPPPKPRPIAPRAAGLALVPVATFYPQRTRPDVLDRGASGAEQVQVRLPALQEEENGPGIHDTCLHDGVAEEAVSALA